MNYKCITEKGSFVYQKNIFLLMKSRSKTGNVFYGVF